MFSSILSIAFIASFARVAFAADFVIDTPKMVQVRKPVSEQPIEISPFL